MPKLTLPRIRVELEIETAVYAREGLRRHAKEHQAWIDVARPKLSPEEIARSEHFVLRLSQAADLINTAIEGRH